MGKRGPPPGYGKGIKHNRTGGGRDGFAERVAAFEQAYLSNGNNATAAALTVGYSPKTAHSLGQRLLKRLKESGHLAVVAQKAAEVAELSTARTLREVRDIAYNDPRRFYRDDGSLRPPKEWDEGMAACVREIDVAEVRDAKGKVTGYAGKLKFWSKIDALDKAMRHAGLFERDNRQKQENLAIQINLVGGPEARPASGVTVQANLVGPKTNGSNGSHA